MCALRVEGINLLGKRTWHSQEWETIAPDEVRRVSEYWLPFPGLSIRTSAASFRVRAGSRYFADVVEHLEVCTPFDIRGSWLHGYIMFWYRRWGQSRPKQDPAGDNPSAMHCERIPLRLEHPALTVAGLAMTACAVALSMLLRIGEPEPGWVFPVIMATGAAGIVILVLSLRTAAALDEADHR